VLFLLDDCRHSSPNEVVVRIARVSAGDEPAISVPYSVLINPWALENFPSALGDTIQRRASHEETCTWESSNGCLTARRVTEDLRV
jgi:hypothetical protein